VPKADITTSLDHLVGGRDADIRPDDQNVCLVPEADIRLEFSHRAIRRHGGTSFMLYCNKALRRDSARTFLPLILVKKAPG
jgi:hypothetical protein